MAVPTFRSYALLHCFEPLRIRGATPARQSCRKAGSKKTPQRGIVGGAPGGDKCVRNVWCCSASIGKKLALLNVVATAVNREPDKNENTLNEAVTLYLPKSACLVLYKLLTKSYKHWRQSSLMDNVTLPDDREPLPSTGLPRWEITTQFARSSMVRSGFLKPDSPRGTWAIASKGIEHLQRARTR